MSDRTSPNQEQLIASLSNDFDVAEMDKIAVPSRYLKCGLSLMQRFQQDKRSRIKGVTWGDVKDWMKETLGRDELPPAMALVNRHQDVQHEILIHRRAERPVDSSTSVAVVVGENVSGGPT